MESILKALQEFLTEPALIIGFYAAIGYTIQKKSLGDIVKGFIKGILGYLLISAGASYVIGSVTTINTILTNVINMESTVIAVNETAFAAATENYGSTMTIVLGLGMLMNLVIARFSRFKFIYLTGHEAMWIATVMTIILSACNLPQWQVIIGGALASGMYYAISPKLIYRESSETMGTDKVAIAHTGNSNYWFAVKTAKLFGNAKNDCENIKLPQSLNFFRDMAVSCSISMFIFIMIFSIAGFCIDGKTTMEVFDGKNWILQNLLDSVEFALGLFIIQQGVKQILGELIPAFKGIANKFIPNAIPAVDIPVLFPFQPNSMLVGFVSSAVTSIIWLFISLFMIRSGFDIPLLIPTLFTAFFGGATIGSLCNKQGGLRGIILGTFLSNGLSIFFIYGIVNIGGLLMPGNVTFGGGDSAIVAMIFGGMKNLGLSAFIFPIICILFIIVMLTGVIGKKRNNVEE